MVLSAMIVAPILEEVLFRGLLLRWLLVRFRWQGAILLQAALFCAVHFAVLTPGDWIRPLQLFLSGCVFGYLFLRTQNLWVPIIVHCVWNISPFLLGSLAGADGMIDQYIPAAEKYTKLLFIAVWAPLVVLFVWRKTKRGRTDSDF